VPTVFTPPGRNGNEPGRCWSGVRPVVAGLNDVDDGTVVAVLALVLPLGGTKVLPVDGGGLLPGGGVTPGPLVSPADRVLSSTGLPDVGHSLTPTGMTSPPFGCDAATFTVTDGGGTNCPTVALATPDSPS
jgi:hypothetical protein